MGERVTLGAVAQGESVLGRPKIKSKSASGVDIIGPWVLIAFALFMVISHLETLN